MRFWLWWTGRSAAAAPTIADAYLEDFFIVPAAHRVFVVEAQDRVFVVPAIGRVFGVDA